MLLLTESMFKCVVFNFYRKVVYFIVELKKTFIRKNTQECLKDNPMLIDNNIIVIKDGIKYVVKIDEKGECVYYEASVSNL